jgi:hypothetical protein
MSSHATVRRSRLRMTSMRPCAFASSPFQLQYHRLNSRPETEQRPDERQGPGFGKRLERGEEFLHQCDNLLAARRAGIVIGDLNVGASGLSTHRADVR